MIDIHTHILPALDDGSHSLAESVAMIEIAARSGTTDLVATPHANLEYRFDPERTGELLAELAQASGNVVRLHRGCDFHLFYDNIQDALANPARYTINGLRYLLVEFPDVLIAKSTDEVLYRLRERGMIPVITHPERNFLLHRRKEQLEAWVESGCLIQVTAQSLLGRFGVEARDFAGELMKRDLVHFIASDAHDPQDRPPRLDEAYREVARKYGQGRAERLFVINPGAALSGDPLPVPAVDSPSPEPRRWYRFW